LENISINPFEPEYIDFYLEIEKAVVSEPLRYDARRFMEIIAREDVVSYSAQKDDEIVAYTIIQLALFEKSVNIIELNVAPKHQRQNVGTNLLDFIQKSALHLNFPVISCQIEKSNQVAHQFLVNNGFEVKRSFEKFLNLDIPGLELTKTLVE